MHSEVLEKTYKLPDMCHYRLDDVNKTCNIFERDARKWELLQIFYLIQSMVKIATVTMVLYKQAAFRSVILAKRYTGQ